MSDDVKGLPDVDGLEDLLTGPQDKVQEPQVEPKVEPQPAQPVQPQAGDKKKIFKSQDDAEEGYRNVQGAYTRETQANKELREQLSAIQEQIQLMQFSRPQPQAQPQDFDTQYIENPQGAIAGIVQQKVTEAQVAATLNEIELQNPAEFQERYAYAQMIARQYPQLATSSAGVKKLFEIADSRRTADLKANALKSVEMLFGSDVDLEKLKALARKDPGQPHNNNAYMPDTTQSSRTGTEPGKDLTIAQAVQNGDVDTVVENLFK